ncbi:MAG: FtsX-like permease family protein [Bacilli bacterium]|nr:FtsX-like permease family protein [Bacilli bacterium]
MKLRDSMTYTLKKVTRKNKNIYFIIILTISTIAIIGALYYRTTFLNRLRIDLTDSFHNRGIMAFKYDNPNYTEILNILHVTEIYDFHYHYSYTFSPTFKNSKYTGNLEFIYGSKNTLPRNIEGNVFDKNDTGVAICPKYFYPSHIQNINYFDPNLFLSKNDILNTTFTIKVPKLIRVDGKSIENGYYIKDFKIIGTYDQLESDNSANTCYVSGRDAKEIFEQTTAALNEENVPTMVVAIDDKANLKKVNNELIKMGYNTNRFSFVESITSLNIKFLSNITILITIAGIIIFTILYVNKKTIDNNQEIGTLKSLGFKSKDIQTINLIEMICITMISYIIGLLIIGLGFIIINTILKNYLIINHIIIYHSTIPYLIALAIIIIIPIIINYFYTYRASKKKAIENLKEETL